MFLTNLCDLISIERLPFSKFFRMCLCYLSSKFVHWLQYMKCWINYLPTCPPCIQSAYIHTSLSEYSSSQGSYVVLYGICKHIASTCMHCTHMDTHADAHFQELGKLQIKMLYLQWLQLIYSSQQNKL